MNKAKKVAKETTNKIYTVATIVVLLAVGASLLVDAGGSFELANEVVAVLGASLLVAGIAKLVKSV